MTAILDLLTTHPTGFTLTEVARRLDLSKSTCLAILTELTAASYLTHDPLTRRFTLGPALVATGEAVIERYPGLTALRVALQDLSDELGVVCGANLLTGDEMVVVLRVGPPDPLDTAPIGQRVPFVPPYGLSFVAWADRATFDAWLQRCPVPLDDVSLRILRTSVAAARQRGFAVLREPATTTMRVLAGELRYHRDRPDYQQSFTAAVADVLHAGFHYDDIRPRERYRFMSIHAPYRAGANEPPISPHVLGSPLEVRGSTILRWADRLTETLRSIESDGGLGGGATA